MTTLWDKYERCANLCSDYLEVFGEHVPMEIMFFHDFDTISEVVERALDNNTKIERK